LARHKAHGLDYARPAQSCVRLWASPDRRALGVKRHAPRLAAHQRGILAFVPLTVVGPGRLLVADEAARAPPGVGGCVSPPLHRLKQDAPPAPAHPHLRTRQAKPPWQPHRLAAAMLE